jgi:hypothetical protein
MLMDSKLTDVFWTHVVNTTIHIQNRVMLRNKNDKTLYELWKGSAENNLYIKICQRNQGICISQTKYIREILKRFVMEDCKLVTTPIQTSCKLRKYDDSKSTDQRKYSSVIGILLYVTSSRLDVMQVVGQVARFQ